MAEDLWGFSLRFYGEAEVQRACLAVQDDHGADVNVALWLLWRGSLGEVIGADGVAAADAAVQPWREAAVVPLRTQRRALKAARLLDDAEAQEALRTKIKKVELEAERLEQRILGSLEVAPVAQAEPQEAARANLAAYANFLGADIPASLVATLAGRLSAMG